MNELEQGTAFARIDILHTFNVKHKRSEGDQPLVVVPSNRNALLPNHARRLQQLIAERLFKFQPQIIRPVPLPTSWAPQGRFNSPTHRGNFMPCGIPGYYPFNNYNPYYAQEMAYRHEQSNYVNYRSGDNRHQHAGQHWARSNQQQDQFRPQHHKNAHHKKKRQNNQAHKQRANKACEPQGQSAELPQDHETHTETNVFDGAVEVPPMAAEELKKLDWEWEQAEVSSVEAAATEKAADQLKWGWEHANLDSSHATSEVDGEDKCDTTAEDSSEAWEEAIVDDSPVLLASKIFNKAEVVEVEAVKSSTSEEDMVASELMQALADSVKEDGDDWVVC
eukprot:Colp12_sorted_trinity150504_noHs@28080